MTDRLPQPLRNAYWFQAFNAISWHICLGGPLILFALELGASATAIGLLVGMAPIMNMAQLPSSRYAEEIGYRKLILTGWSLRVAVLIFLALLPLLALILPSQTVVILLIAVMFCFTLLRGISVCAWMPWISAMVPESLRGTYLANDRRFVNMAGVFALLISGAILYRGNRMGAFAIVFLVGFAAGAVSLYFLRRLPDVPSPLKSGSTTVHASWREILADVPFRRLLIFSAVAHLALSAHGNFTVVFLMKQMKLEGGPILWLNAGSAFMGILALTFLAARTDRVGSKPFLGLVFFWWLAHFFLWFLVSIHGVGNPRMLSQALVVAGGFFGSLFDLALTRLLMNMVGNKPAKTRYFSTYTVVVSVMIGLAPIVWGVLLDGLSTTIVIVKGYELDRYSFFFGAEWLMLGVVGIMLAQLKEAKSESATFMVYQIFVGTPARTLSTLLQRVRE